MWLKNRFGILLIHNQLTAIQIWNVMESDIAARIVVKEKQDQKKASITSMMSQSLKESVRILLKRKIIESEIFTAIM
jgi:hypothetical protein